MYLTRLPLYTSGKRFDNGEGGVEAGDKYWAKAADPSKSLKSAVIEGLESWLENGAKLVLVYPVPEAGWNVKYEAQRALQSTRSLAEKQVIMKTLDLSTSLMLLWKEAQRPETYWIM